MVNGIEFKVCGLTRVADAEAAERAGADFLGFIFHPKSPRRIRIEHFKEIQSRLPDLPRVAVTVAPDLSTLAELEATGFDYFQIHFPLGLSEEVPAWSKFVGPERLWLAPKMPPELAFDPGMLAHCSGVLWDAFKKDASAYGGTGQRSDWGRYRELRERHPERRWLLAGGISPENAAEAVAATGSRCLDFNSGLESEPGVKDPDRVSLVRESLSAIRHDAT